MQTVFTSGQNQKTKLKYFLHCLAAVRRENEHLGRAEFSVEVMNNAGRVGHCCACCCQEGWP